MLSNIGGALGGPAMPSEWLRRKTLASSFKLTLSCHHSSQILLMFEDFTNRVISNTSLAEKYCVSK
jgi:hypothetical protein